MSEENKDGQEAGGEQKPEFRAITSQEEFDQALSKRLERERAKFADYDDLKAKASKFDEVEESNKTELQKLQERATAAEQRATQAELTALRTAVAAETNVPVEVLHGNDEESIRAAAQKVLEWRDAGKKPAPKPSALKSGSAADDKSGLTGKQRAAELLRTMRQNG